MQCHFCGRETEGYRKPGPGHARVSCCPVCYKPKQYAWCECGGVKSARARYCRGCPKYPRVNKDWKRKAEREKREARREKIRSVTKFMKDTPIPAGVARPKRDELHERKETS